MSILPWAIASVKMGVQGMGSDSEEETGERREIRERERRIGIIMVLILKVN